MYARLNPVYGWAWLYEDGSTGPFIIFDIERYNGMITGFTPDGRKCARPQTEFDALSHDGEMWHPVTELLSLVPSEATQNVRVRNLPLPVSLDKDP